MLPNLIWSYVIYTRGELTSRAKQFVGVKRPGENVLGAKRLGEDMVLGQNVTDSFWWFLKIILPVLVLLWHVLAISEQLAKACACNMKRVICRSCAARRFKFVGGF